MNNMKNVFSIILILQILFSFANSTKNINHLQTDSSKVKSLLFYYEKTLNKYNFFKRELPSDSNFLIAQFDKLPYNVIWDTINHYAYFITKKGVLKRNYLENKSIIETISDSIPCAGKSGFKDAWFENGFICVSYYIDVKVGDRLLKAKYNQLRYSADYLPDWGADQIVGIIVLNKQGKWDVVKEKATKMGADLTPGFMVLDNFIKKDKNYFSTTDILSASVLGNRFLTIKFLNEVELFKKTKYYNFFSTKMVDNESEYCFNKINKKFDLISSVIRGDTYHYVNPIYIYDYDKLSLKKIIQVNKYQKQMSIQICGNFILIGEEYTNNSVLIFDANSFNIIGRYPNSKNAIIINHTLVN